MENRKRSIRLRFDLTDKEKELFKRKKEESGAVTLYEKKFWKRKFMKLT